MRPTLDYGTNNLWPTPVRLRNLLEEGLVEPELHEWLARYAENPRLLSSKNRNDRGYGRQDGSVFTAPEHREIEEITEILTGQVDEYVRETMPPLQPGHEKKAMMWFLIQRPSVLQDVPGPHCHEAGDVAFTYYLSVPGDGSGVLMLLDPRGAIHRGGRAFPRPYGGLSYQPRRGDLVMFPRYLTHDSSVNTDGYLRKLIAGVLRYDLPHEATDRYWIDLARTKVPLEV
jgi:hypothetical protein